MYMIIEQHKFYLQIQVLECSRILHMEFTCLHCSITNMCIVYLHQETNMCFVLLRSYFPTAYYGSMKVVTSCFINITCLIISFGDNTYSASDIIENVMYFISCIYLCDCTNHITSIIIFFTLLLHFQYYTIKSKYKFKNKM